MRYCFAVCFFTVIHSVSPCLNEVRGAHDDEQQSGWPGTRRGARVARRTSREGARCNQHESCNFSEFFCETLLKHVRR